MKKITVRQRQVLDHIIQYISDYGYPPTLMELTNLLGASSRNTAVKHVHALAQKGYIHWEKNKARGLRVLDTRQRAIENEISLPLIGSVRAGSPMLAEENVERHIPIPRHFMPTPGSHFLLRVQGESMINAGILENDIVIVRSQSQANVGEIVVALIENEATVKRLARSQNKLYLKAENDRVPDIHPFGAWSIQGRVVALMREHIT